MVFSEQKEVCFVDLSKSLGKGGVAIVKLRKKIFGSDSDLLRMLSLHMFTV